MNIIDAHVPRYIKYLFAIREDILGGTSPKPLVFPISVAESPSLLPFSALSPWIDLLWII